jgi:hypothetical protein
MAVDTPSYFAQVIQDHLELKRQNAELEDKMPLARYINGDPFENHPLFKSEEQARLEDTMDGEPAVIAAEETAPPVPEDTIEHVYAPADDTGEALWSRSREFDWGD